MSNPRSTMRGSPKAFSMRPRSEGLTGPATAHRTSTTLPWIATILHLVRSSDILWQRLSCSITPGRIIYMIADRFFSGFDSHQG
jgi:hypothetical protein